MKRKPYINRKGMNPALLQMSEQQKAATYIDSATRSHKLITDKVLHDEFGFGGRRCQRFIKRFNTKAECLVDDMASWDDYIQMIRKELGIEIVIRRNE